MAINYKIILKQTKTLSSFTGILMVTYFLLYLQLLQAILDFATTNINLICPQ